jgi:hypothetical protein
MSGLQVRPIHKFDERWMDRPGFLDRGSHIFYPYRLEQRIFVSHDWENEGGEWNQAGKRIGKFILWSPDDGGSKNRPIQVSSNYVIFTLSL